MEFWGLQNNPRFKQSAALVAVLVAGLLISNVFVLGGDDFFNISNALLAPAAAWIACLLFIRAREIVKDPLSRQMWLGMAWGFGLWAAADTIYAWYTVALGTEPPYPSFADLIWMIGYIPLYWALILRVQTLKIRPTAGQRWILALVSGGFLALTVYFVLGPILVDFDPTRLLESIVNVAYPLGDLGLVILTTRVLILLQKGRFSLPWRLILAGIFLMTFSDLLYSFAVWQELYYPDGRVNLITNLTDTTYWLAYASAAYGVYLYGVIWEIKAAPGLRFEVMPSTKYQTLISTDRDNRLISVSDNFYILIDPTSPGTHRYSRLPLADALGIHASAAAQLVERVRRQGVLFNEPLTIRTQANTFHDVWVTALAFYEMDNTFSGLNIAISADLRVPEDLRLPRGEDFQAMLNHLISLAGSRPEDEIQAMRAYLLEIIGRFASMLYQFGGEPFKQALFDDLNQTIQKKGLPARLTSESITILEECQGDGLARVLTPLLDTALRHTSDLFGPRMVRDEIEDYEKQLNATILRDLDKYGLRAYHLGR